MAAKEARAEDLSQQQEPVAASAPDFKLSAATSPYMGQGIMITNGELERPGPKILFVDEAICRITGYSASELIGQSPRILQGGNTNRATLGHLKRELSAGRACIVDLINYRKDGTQYNAELFITPLIDARGRHPKFVSIHRNMSDRSRTAQALYESKEHMRAILNTASDAIITIDQRGIITAVNPAAGQIFGYAQEELVGQNVRMLMPAPYFDEHDGYIARFLETGEARIIGGSREVVGRRKGGETFPADLAVSQIDHLGLFMGIIRDASHQKQLQKQVLEIAVAEQRRIGQELHDGTGQELTGLTLFAGTLVDLLNNAPRRATAEETCWQIEVADLHKLRQVANRLSEGLVEAHHHVQQLSHGIMPALIEVEGLQTALQELADATDAQEKFTCRFECSESIKVASNTTATQLYRIAQEAVNNAIRHSQADQIVISLQQVKEEIVLQVSDNGVGIEPESISRSGVFGSTQGFGLGIMNYRAGMIGAMLRVTRQAEKGTLVKCTLPREIAYGD